MTNVLTLDAIKHEVRRKYQPVVLELGDEVTVELKPVLRLGAKDRQTIKDAVKEVQGLEDMNDEEAEDDDELVEELASEVCRIIGKALRVIATSPRKLLSALDDEEDPRIRAELYTEVLRVWMGETQMGEASSSPS